jgi:hypothetical protein
MNTLFSKYLLVILIIFLFNFFDFSQINKENSNTQRLALVIGNNDYIFGTKLKNAVNDADLVSKVLKSLNFEILTKSNQITKLFFFITQVMAYK